VPGCVHTKKGKEGGKEKETGRDRGPVPAAATILHRTPPRRLQLPRPAVHPHGAGGWSEQPRMLFSFLSRLPLSYDSFLCHPRGGGRGKQKGEGGRENTGFLVSGRGGAGEWGQGYFFPPGLFFKQPVTEILGGVRSLYWAP